MSPLPAPSPEDRDRRSRSPKRPPRRRREDRAELVAVVTDAASARGINAYGALSTSTTTTAIVTSAGLRRAATSTQASLVSVARGDDGGGYASRHSADIAALDVPVLAAEVVDTCERNQGATAIDPGDYEVILSPYAVTDMLEHLAWVGFSALAVQEHRSFMRIGEKLMSDMITIRDDARTRDVFPFPFDDEGVSTRPVTLIDRGVCSAVVYDTPTALRGRRCLDRPLASRSRTRGVRFRATSQWMRATRPGREMGGTVSRAVCTSRASGTCATCIRCAP